MVRKVMLFVGVLGLLSPLAMAQYDEYKIELTPFVGYTFSEGVNVSPTNIGGGEVVNRISPTSGLSYGFTVDYLAGENFGIGFGLGCLA